MNEDPHSIELCWSWEWLAYSIVLVAAIVASVLRPWQWF